MTQILSLGSFESPSFEDAAAVGFIRNALYYCDSGSLRDETQPFFKYLREYPRVSIAPDTLATRETARMVCTTDVFVPVHDSIFKKIASVWREKGLSEAICLAASADPEEVTVVVHRIATRW